MTALRREMRYAGRMLRRAPLFAATAVAVLALGIAVNLALLTLTQALLLRPLPLPEPERLMRIAFGEEEKPLSLDGPLFDAFALRQRAFAGTLAWARYDFTVGGGARAAMAAGAFVTGDAFAVLGARPRLGRLIAPDDDRPGGGPDGWAAVLSDRCWRERYGADPSVIGSVVRLDGAPVRIVGVLGGNFTGIVVGEQPDFFVPFASRVSMQPPPTLKSPGNFALVTLGRLRPGETAGSAVADLRRLEPEALREAVPPDVLNTPTIRGMHYRLEPGRTGWSPFRRGYLRPLRLLHALAALILLACCATVSGLQLARAARRQPELDLRVALGGSRWQLMLPLACEGALLASAGALLGAALALPLSRFLTGYFDAFGAPLDLRLDLDPPLLLATAGVAALCTALVGLLPALRATGRDTARILRGGGRDTGPQRRGLARWLVPVQVALSLLLVVVAGLLSASLARLLYSPAGFVMQGVLVAPADFAGSPEGGARLVGLYRRILERLSAAPSIEAASLVSTPPFLGHPSISDLGAVGSSREDPRMVTHFVGPGFFQALGTRLIEGAGFASADLGGAPRSCVLSESAARFLFPERSAVGRQVRTLDRRQFPVPIVCSVIGVAEDTRYVSLDEPAPRTVYFPMHEAMNQSLTDLSFVVRGRDAAQAARSFAAVLQELAPEASLGALQPLRNLMGRAAGRERMMAALAQLLAAAALLLSAIGMFGLFSGNVTARTREIGIRTALGASHGELLRTAMEDGLRLLALGAAAGLAGGLAGARLVSRFLYGTSPFDPIIYLGAAAVLALTAALAAWMPAYRAIHIDPVSAIRS